MSAAGRTAGLRVRNDQYPTAPWAVHRFLEAVPWLPATAPEQPGRWLEPCAGDGYLLRAANAYLVANGYVAQWHACDIDPKYEEALKASANRVVIGDFLKVVPAHYDVVITNPPYSLAEEFLRACLPIAKHVAMLLRIGWAESRGELLREHPADVYMSPDRIPFGRNKHGKIGTDASHYAWFHWHPDAKGLFRVLGDTSKEVRAGWRETLDAITPLQGEETHGEFDEVGTPFLPGIQPQAGGGEAADARAEVRDVQGDDAGALAEEAD